MKYIDINNEEEILKYCHFDYYYESEECSRELCMFYNDLCNKVFMNTQFDNKQSKIDLGRIGITLNKQHQKIADLEAKLEESEEYNKMLLEEKGIYTDLVSGYSKKCKNYEQQLADMTKKYELACLPMGGLVDMARNLEQQLAEKEEEIEDLIHKLNKEVK